MSLKHTTVMNISSSASEIGYWSSLNITGKQPMEMLLLTCLGGNWVVGGVYKKGKKFSISG